MRQLSVVNRFVLNGQRNPLRSFPQTNIALYGLSDALGRDFRITIVRLPNQWRSRGVQGDKAPPHRLCELINS